MIRSHIKESKIYKKMYMFAYNDKNYKLRSVKKWA